MLIQLAVMAGLRGLQWQLIFTAFVAVVNLSVFDKSTVAVLALSLSV